MTRTLRDFVGLHSGETAWLFGKGPSLSRFDFGSAGPLRCAVNESVRYVPSVTYCFANDGVLPWVDLYDSTHVLFQPSRTIEDSHMANPASWPCELVRFDNVPDVHIAGRTVDDLVSRGLAMRHGTIGTAIQVLYIMGVAKVVCVGVDGVGGHVGLDLRSGPSPDCIYSTIRDRFISAATMLGIEIEFFDAPAEVCRTDGLVVVLITHGVVAGGQARRDGDIVALKPSEASELIQRGVAEPTRNFPLPRVEATK